MDPTLSFIPKEMMSASNALSAMWVTPTQKTSLVAPQIATARQARPLQQHLTLKWVMVAESTFKEIAATAAAVAEQWWSVFEGIDSATSAGSRKRCSFPGIQNSHGSIFYWH
jgi:hypothetical protein